MNPKSYFNRFRRSLLVASFATLLPFSINAQQVDAQQISWTQLSQAQKMVLAPFQDQWNSLPGDDQQFWVRLAQRFPDLQPQLRLRATSRIRQWASLSTSQRETARRNFRLARERGRNDRVKEWQRYRQMTPEQRSVLRSHGGRANIVRPAATNKPR